MAKKTKPKATAESMAKGQRDISVSEFFAKNRHLLGFDNPRKALLTTVKEAVDNALDACEEAEILPDIAVTIEDLSPPSSPTAPNKSSAKNAASRYRITVEDNGPGIVRRQVENIFGRLLYGSKFHRMKMSRGQQGIGISAAGMYGLMTTGRPLTVVTRPNPKKPAHFIELAMDTTKNTPVVTQDIELADDDPKHLTLNSPTGTKVSIELEARYMKGKTSVDEYLEQTAIANPHAKIIYTPPATNGTKGDDQQYTLEGDPIEKAESEDVTTTTKVGSTIIFPRTVDELPPETSEIKPHPYGVELGTFLQKLNKTGEKQIAGFLKNEFCRIPPSVVKETTKKAGITGQTWVKSVDHAAAEKLYKAIQNSKLRAPPTDCLSPIGVRQMLAGMLKGVQAEFFAATTRPPAVYRGNPFQIEAAIAFGGDLGPEQSDEPKKAKDAGPQQARVIRFANRVPLLYQQSACSSFKSVLETSWRNYGLTQPRGTLPQGPIVIMIHMASVWVPFTSESKEAIADYDEIRKEMRLALQECGRKLGIYLRKRQKMRREGQRRHLFERYIGEVVKACHAITGADAEKLHEALKALAERKTEFADVELDEDGRVVKGEDTPSRLDKDDSVIIIPSTTDDEDDDQPAQASPKPTDTKRAPSEAPAARTKGAKGKKKTKQSATSAPRTKKKRVRVNLVAADTNANGDTLF